MFPPRKIIVVAIAVILSCPVPQYGTNRTPGIHKKTVQAILSLRGTVCGNGKERTALQRCTQNAGKRFTFATGQYRERHHRPCGNGQERTPLQRCTQNAGKRFTFATGQYRECRHRRCGNGKERTPRNNPDVSQNCTHKTARMPLNAPDLPRSDTTALADYAELRKYMNRKTGNSVSSRPQNTKNGKRNTKYQR